MAPVQHGHARRDPATGVNRLSPTYVSWLNMRYRCRHYPDYAGRGITWAGSWDDFARFLSDMGERPAGTSLDRIDNDGNYEPGNCRWATPEQQVNNRRPSSQWRPRKQS